MTKFFAVAIVLSSLLTGSVFAARDTDGDGVATILLPIAVPQRGTPGAHGSFWTGQLWVHNASQVAVLGLQGAPGGCVGDCPPSLPPGWIGDAQSISIVNGGSGLIGIRPDIADQLHFSARLLEVTRRAQPTGVEIPLVGEEEFLSRPAEYLGVPVSPGIRAALRVYDPRRKLGSAVQVEFLSPAGEIVATTTVRPGDNIGQSVWEPGFAAIYDITEAFPELRGRDYIHIRLTPLADFEYWAMVSVTDNTSQHVLLITAQP